MDHFSSEESATKKSFKTDKVSDPPALPAINTISETATHQSDPRKRPWEGFWPPPPPETEGYDYGFAPDSPVSTQGN
ncbi:hypothetical protein N7504_010831 [Penicillium tannophilum]|nr:hypothetical protein N7504_010831 [Penicillium tannophilum]